MKQERNFVYDKDTCMPDQRCDGCPLYLFDPNHMHDDILFTLVLSSKDEYYIEVGIRIKLSDGNWARDYFEISMERPEFIMEPLRNLTYNEKIMLNEYSDKCWSLICSEMKRYCIEECINMEGGCDKFYNRPIPTTHPDYTLLPDLY